MSDGTLRDYMAGARTRLARPGRKRGASLKGVSQLEETLWFQFQAEGIAARCTREYQFAPPRKWRFDFAFLHCNLAIECDGGIWRQSGKGAHTGGSAQIRDNEKNNAAGELGWRVLHYDLKAIKSGAALAQIVRVLNQRFKP